MPATPKRPRCRRCGTTAALLAGDGACYEAFPCGERVGAKRERGKTRAVLNDVIADLAARLETAEANKAARRQEYRFDPSNVDRHIAYRDAIAAVGECLAAGEVLAVVARKVGR
jgi:hypothetical protein